LIAASFVAASYSCQLILSFETSKEYFGEASRPLEIWCQQPTVIETNLKYI